MMLRLCSANDAVAIHLQVGSDCKITVICISSDNAHFSIRILLIQGNYYLRPYIRIEIILRIHIYNNVLNNIRVLYHPRE